MKELLRKYRNGQLTSSELEQLRLLMSQTTDDDLLNIIEGEANEYYAEWDMISEDELRRILEEIKAELFPNTSTLSTLLPPLSTFLRYAAVILMPVLLFTTTYLYYKNHQVVQSEVCITTDAGEKANITLPDGTKVKLNANSELSYVMSEFGDKSRNVSFKGEAYFDVAKKHGSSFSISGKDNTVTVLGTKFNLRAYDDDANVTVSLEEGTVAFQSTATSSAITMAAGDIAVLDRTTGEITICNTESIKSHTAWKNNEIIITHATLTEALEQIEEQYGVKFKVNAATETTETITGVLPTNNLVEALDIIERLYHVKSEIHGRIVEIRK